ncbi:hypothetical protein [Actinomadura hibisca]|uniref:hypothetical protein n=1 Tax=Actinomadura hibisca TaxID=68565 RepID=UPI0008296E87|nr:hypothetical protein [Actinomadura hibisca]
MSFKTGRAALTACVTAGLVLGLPAVANADVEYNQSWMKADASGSQLHIRRAFVRDNGEVGFRDSYYSAGPEGASVRHTYSGAR